MVHRHRRPRLVVCPDLSAALAAPPMTETAARAASPPAAPTQHATAVLVFADGSAIRGRGFGAAGRAVGELCFNTAMTGYQEVLTDPSYAGQIIAFTFPHIGNVGVNDEDLEAARPAARGCVLRADAGAPSNWRATAPLDAWLKAQGAPAMAGVDTRALTRRVRAAGAPTAVIAHDPAGRFDIAALAAEAAAWPGLAGMDLAREVTCEAAHEWTQTGWTRGRGYGALAAPRRHVVAVDYGAKRNILRCLADAGCRVTVVPATASADEILRYAPDGVFLSNGPGGPDHSRAAGSAGSGLRHLPRLPDAGAGGRARGRSRCVRATAAPTIRSRTSPPGGWKSPARTTVSSSTATVCRRGVALTHLSLFDGTVEGVALSGKPAFGVQYHPEASPGPPRQPLSVRSLLHPHGRLRRGAMPKRTDIESILIVGAGPIVIGQACEFDYSGAQACKALRAEGYRVVLVNSNPATIMTDPDTADATYVEPITPALVERVIAREKPDALLATMGGQTALNTAFALAESGALAAHGGRAHRRRPRGHRPRRGP